MPRAAAFDHGIALFRAGHIVEAEACFRDALRAQPNSPQLHTALGAMLASQGRIAEAVPSFRAALELQPGSADAHGNLGNALRELGRAQDAMHHLREALRLRKDYPEAHNNLGALLRELGDFAAAEEHFNEALRLRPDFIEARGNLGKLLLSQNRVAEAATHFSAALRSRPNDADLLTALGATLRALSQLHEAESATRQALSLRPELIEPRIELGNVLYELGRAEEARDEFRSVRARDPNSAIAQLGLGVTSIMLGLFDDAEAALRVALSQKPDFAEAYNALGDLMRNRGRLDDSETALREALRLKSNYYPDAQVNLAFTLLQAGRFAEGWRAHEHRTQANAWRTYKEKVPGTRWHGEPLANRTLLIHAEQGLGDSIQFFRYLSRIERSPRVIVRVQASLVQLLATSFPTVQAIAENAPLPAFDLQCPLLSLPHVLGDDAPPAPYLAADPARVAQWRGWVDRLPGRRVGLVWAGNPRLAADKRRSIPLASLAPLGEIAGVSFVSLQHGPAASQKPPSGLALHDRAGELTDFADTAALVSALDLVIGVDTATVHLAGALGRPVWLLNRADTCWRWMAEPGTSMLYPTLREFRQHILGDWGSVIAATRDALGAFAATPQQAAR